MLTYLFIIPFVIPITIGDSHEVEQCQPENTQWSVEDTRYIALEYRGDVYAYAVCKPGLRISSNTKVRCKDGWWDNPLPRCEKIVSKLQCELLSVSENVMKHCIGGAPSVNSVCHFRCINEQYLLTGSPLRRCLQNLQWSGVTAKCIPVPGTREKSVSAFSNITTTYPRKVAVESNSSRPSRVNNSCEENNGGCDDICNFRSGSVHCSCHPGYILQNGKNCIDIDECLEGRYCHHNCNNTKGSYFCSCKEGYKLKNAYHCEDINECAVNNGGCSNTCINSPGSYHCLCPDGYHLDGGKTCIDVDECLLARTNRCNQTCNNTLGSYFCSCKPGFFLKNSYECEGCRKNSYKSEKDISCIECPPHSVTDSEAKESIAHCFCSPGFLGDPSRNIPCDDIDECLTNKFGCSDICVNTPGGAHCSCPPGFELKDDDKTCVDTDECSTKNGGCQMHCQNTIGNFSCSCSEGYLLSKDKYSCDDIDECEINNGDCSNVCNNFPGGHYCSCPKGYRLNVEGKICTAVRCPAIAVPHHSTMRCFPKSDKTKKQIVKPNDENSPSPTDYPVDTICRFKCNTGYDLSSSHASAECLENGSWNASTPRCIVSHCPLLEVPDNGDVYPPECTEGPVTVKQQCYFTCNPGYHLSGKKNMLKCKNSLTWSSEPPSCKPDKIVPFLSCPDDITIDLKENESSANVTVPRPATNMDDIVVYPDWIILEELISFPSGETNILFTASSINYNATTHCIMTVNAIDKEPPVFVRCPESFGVDGASSRGIPVSWDEPIADDNIGIQTISTNLEPNSTLTAGIHYVEYIAKDAAGNVAQCSFQINVTRAHCGDLNDPENGKANCMDWLLGKLCRPSCESGYERDPSEPKFFACGDSAVWTPTDSISPCLPECVNGTVWSSASETCELIDVI